MDGYEFIRQLSRDSRAAEEKAQRLAQQELIAAEREKQYLAEMEEEKNRLHAELEKGMAWEPHPEVRGAIVIQSATIGDAGVDDQGDSNTQKIKNRKFEYPETTEWKTKAWGIGKKWFDEEPKNGKYPGVVDVAKHVEAQFKSLDIRGPRGDYLDWQTIKREALTGVTGRPANGKNKKS